MDFPEPPEDWPVPMEALTPETLAYFDRAIADLERWTTEVEEDVQDRLSRAMERGFRHHYAKPTQLGDGRDAGPGSSL